ncbi:MAG: membrane protein [Hyphococcus sp.]|nr:MAG: membrane protein [Marinicaulis sp.]
MTQPSPKGKRLPGEGAILAARIVLFWEQLWPALLPALTIVFAYLFMSLCDLWKLVPVWLHWLALMLGGAGFVALLYRDLSSLRFPTRREGQARLERDGGVVHAALQALDDSPFESDVGEPPLWRAHQQAMRERARAARLKSARDLADRRDPWGLRHIALGLLAIAFVAGGKDSMMRLALGGDPQAHAGSGKLVADLWIEPPVYVGRAPIYLLHAGQPLPEGAAQIDAPEGSKLIAQVNGGGRVKLTFQTPDETIRGDFKREKNAGRAEFAIGDSGLLRLKLGGREGRWPIGVLRDSSPSVRFTETPARTDDGRVDFAITMEDDYGITDARLSLRLDPDQERPLDAAAFDEASLVQSRSIPLEGVAGASGARAATLDLQSDPWAGLQVLAKVIVRDGAGQEGGTNEASLTLPTRMFYNPIAKAVIEQRQTLAVAETDWRRAARSFDAMTLAPDIFYAEKPTNYLLLRSAFWRVMRQNGDSYEDAVEQFWPLALQLEDEALELARQRLEAAREALRQALENGASDAEVERLVEELRQAMNDYLTALAQSGQAMEGETPSNAHQVEQSDLDDMLDAIRDLSQQGANNAARQMLSDLENMLNNLRLSQSRSGQGGLGSGQQSGANGQSGRAGEAGELIGRQRELADETFERRQSGRLNGDDLAVREGQLGGDLDELMDALEGESANDPNGEAGRALGRARSAMREAEGALAGDDFAAANDAMERAIANLRDGAEALAREQMRQARGEGEGQEGQRGRTDPLGRAAGSSAGDGVEVPGESEAGRTRAVIDELRRRLGEPGREENEKDYLERLLERF